MKRSFITSLGGLRGSTRCRPLAIRETRFRERHSCFWAGIIQDRSCSAAASVTLRPRCPGGCSALGPVGVDDLDPPGLRLKHVGGDLPLQAKAS